jgi:two-component system cell cycle response regulator
MPSALPPPSILIVEDSSCQAEQLRLMLEKHGFTVRIAFNGKQALESIRNEPPSLVISDILMPEMDGYQLCAAIRADGTMRELPVVLLTALSSPRDILHALECDADNFITKPYNEQYLVSRMESIMDGIRRRGSHDAASGAEIVYQGERFCVAGEQQRVFDLLFSTYEAMVLKNRELQDTQRELSEKVVELEEALERVRQLEGIIPICMHCKKIRDDRDYWHQIDQFIARYSDMQFSHGICPECLKKYYGDYQLKKNRD